MYKGDHLNAKHTLRQAVYIQSCEFVCVDTNLLH